MPRKSHFEGSAAEQVEPRAKPNAEPWQHPYFNAYDGREEPPPAISTICRLTITHSQNKSPLSFQNDTSLPPMQPQNRVL
jgi:hypothetical protein